MAGQIRIGDLLVSMGCITLTQLDSALKVQKQTGDRIGAVLVRSGAITEVALIHALAKQLGIEPCQPSQVEVREAVRDLIPADVVHELRILPISLRRQEDFQLLTLATADPLDPAPIRRIRDLLGDRVRVQWRLAGEQDLDAAIEKNYGPLPDRVAQKASKSAAAIAASLDSADPLSLDLSVDIGEAEAAGIAALATASEFLDGGGADAFPTSNPFGGSLLSDAGLDALPPPAQQRAADVGFGQAMRLGTDAELSPLEDPGEMPLFSLGSADIVGPAKTEEDFDLGAEDGLKTEGNFVLPADAIAPLPGGALSFDELSLPDGPATAPEGSIALNLDEVMVQSPVPAPATIRPELANDLGVTGDFGFEPSPSSVESSERRRLNSLSETKALMTRFLSGQSLETESMEWLMRVMLAVMQREGFVDDKRLKKAIESISVST